MSNAEVLALLDAHERGKIVRIDVTRLTEWAKRNRTQFDQLYARLMDLED